MARIPLKSVLYLMKHLFWTFKCFDMRELLTAQKQKIMSAVQSKTSKTMVPIPHRKSDLSAVMWEGISDVYLF